MFNKRSRTVSFRLSDKEYQLLKRVSAKCGARSLSDFTRSVACGFNAMKSGSENGIDKIDDQLRILNNRVEALDRRLRMLADELRGRTLNDSMQVSSKEELS